MPLSATVYGFRNVTGSADGFVGVTVWAELSGFGAQCVMNAAGSRLQ